MHEDQLIKDFFEAIRTKRPMVAFQILDILYYQQRYDQYYRLYDSHKTVLHGYMESNNKQTYDQSKRENRRRITAVIHSCEESSNRLRRDNAEWDRVTFANKQDARSHQRAKGDSPEATEGCSEG